MTRTPPPSQPAQQSHPEDIPDTTERSHLQPAPSRDPTRSFPQSYVTQSQNDQRHQQTRPFLDEKPSIHDKPRLTRRTILILVLITIVVSYATLPSWPNLNSTSSAELREDLRVGLPNIERPWGAYTPYFSVEPYKPPPPDCKITQVNIIQRHGARYPTSQAGPHIQAAVAKLQSVSEYKDKRLDFLKNYTYTLGVEDLVPFGALEAQLAGQITYDRYSHLGLLSLSLSQAPSPNNLPFIRSSGDQRVVDSARNWTFGFSKASHGIYEPTVSVIIEAGEGKNNTLSGRSCPNANLPSSSSSSSTWLKLFAPPIAARLNLQAPGSGIEVGDVPVLMALCAFESVGVAGVGASVGLEMNTKMRISPFCHLFTEDEFEQYEYLADLGKYYKTGYGNTLGRIQGVGFVNELLARLTRTPVHDHTQTNQTLDANPDTFPLDRNVYVDFSHDDQMVAVYSAIGLFRRGRGRENKGKQKGNENENQHLDPTNPDPKRTWLTSRLTPFSARMVVEKWHCEHERRCGGDGDSISSKKGEYVRILVNDAIQPLEFCGGDRDPDRLCELGEFVKSQGYARRDGDGDFERCF
ncbi:histidine phosphatase superfamily [Crepidotus variabilis]|uniref:Histidine phosphatase superfamily n=1 Tax=Crepidotus variabilis TaxID=179855 RepID=A0A9P6E3Y7_9AGAR|nr:histidine phosphatase superfamily [Crepidotus variabilis]